MAKKTNQSTHEVEVKIEGADWTKAVDDAFNKKNKTITVDGFRKGKCPRSVYEKKFGKESLFLDAADNCLQKAYEKALLESKLIPVVQPNVELKSIDENGVSFVFKIITKPEVHIKNYKDLHVKREEVKVSQEEIEHEIHHLLDRFAEMVTKTEGTVEEGNLAIIDYEGFHNKVPFEGGKAENYSLEIGSHTFIPGFEEQLIGMKIAEEKDIQVTFPEDYPSEELKGQEVTFKVKVNEIKEKVERELDKDFFDDLAMEGINDKKSLEEKIEKNIKAQKEMDAENNYIDNLLETISKNVDVDIPEEMIDEEIDRMMHRMEENLKMQGISLDLFYQYTHSDEKTLKEQFEKEAFQNVLYRLMLEEIMNLEKIEVSPEDADKEAEELAQKYQMEKDELIKNFGGLDMITYDLEMRKTIELLKELNQ